MQNKKLYLMLAVVLIIVGAAAFVAGRLMNGGPNALGIFPGGILPFGGSAQMVSRSINMIPAPELPTTQPDAVGSIVSREDNTLTLQTFSMAPNTGSGGMVTGSVQVSGGSSENGEGLTITGPGADGPKVEVVITNETKIYKEVTEMFTEPPAENATVQQKVELTTADEINSQSMLMVWGRKSGDRLIADVISFSNPIMIKK